MLPKSRFMLQNTLKTGPLKHVSRVSRLSRLSKSSSNKLSREKAHLFESALAVPRSALIKEQSVFQVSKSMNSMIFYRSYCNIEGNKNKEPLKDEESEKVDAPDLKEPEVQKEHEETPPVEGSPFRRPGHSNREHKGEEEETDKPHFYEAISLGRQSFPSRNPPPGLKFSPSYIITINTEKNFLAQIWRGFGLLSFNLTLALCTAPKSKDGIAEFWAKQIYTAKIDAALAMLGLCAFTGNDLTLFVVYLVSTLLFPQHFIPSAFRTPTRAEVRAFVFEHLRDIDTEGTGKASIQDASRVLGIVQRDMSLEVTKEVLVAAGASSTEVDYAKLADVVGAEE